MKKAYIAIASAVAVVASVLSFSVINKKTKNQKKNHKFM